MNRDHFSSLVTNRSNTHQAVWVAMGSFSSLALSIVSAAILSRYFDKTEYGTYRQILYVYNTLLIIFSAGLPQVFSYFLPRYNLEQGKEIVLKISRILFFAGLVFSFFLFFSSGLIADILRNPELSNGLKYFSPIPMLLLPTLGIEGVFSAYKKTIYIAIYNTATRLLMLLLITLPVIIFKGTYLSAIMGWIVASIITLILAYFFKGIPFKKVKMVKTDLTLKEIFSYSLPLVGAGLAGIALRSADQFYISRFFGAETFAEFSNGFIQLPFALMITGAVGTVLTPVFSKMFHDNADKSSIISLWQSTLHKSAVLIYPMVIYFLFFSTEIITILYSKKYLESAVYFTIALTINFFNITAVAPFVLAMGKTRFYAKVHLFFAITAWVIEYLIAVLIGEPVLIAVYSAFQTSLMGIVFIVFIAKHINVRLYNLFPLGKLILISLHSLIVVTIVKVAVVFLMSNLSSLVVIIISSISFFVLMIISSPIVRLNYFDVLKPLLVK